MNIQKNTIITCFENLFSYHPKEDYQFSIPETLEKKQEQNYSSESSSNLELPKNIFPTLSVNLEVLTSRYNTMINSDIIIREFSLTAKNKEYKAFLFYIDGMVDTTSINHFVLDPLMLRNSANTYQSPESEVIKEAITNNIVVRKVKKFDLASYIYNHLVPQNSVEQVDTFDDVASGVNSGNCALFVDTLNIVFNIDVKGFKQRSVEKPENEIVIRGSQEGFTENIRTNTSLLRRFVNNEKLIIENIEVGNLTKTKCAVCYMKNIANTDLIAEVKYRLNNIDVDTIISSGQLEQLIEDNGKFSLPQLISSERPDKASNFLLEGRVVILVNGSPYCLIAPGTFIDFITSPEDLNLKFQFANLLKIIRILAVILTLLLPGLYVAITNFHQELIPTELLFAIVAARESIPLPIIFEILVMEVSFELIREAGLRVPSPIGPTIGIVGALILGQAAVDANIVSPILIIVVAITAIASFAIPDFSFGFHCRIARFVYIAFGYFLGFLGIAFCLFIHFLILSELKSFGYSYLQPYIPVTKDYKGIFLSPSWKREHRASFLNTKRPKRQADISMTWKNNK
ncbi:MAG: spore germination protein [Clostridia bacterium]|nr:spore germination protein [Clostridia bacterium]